MYCFVAALNWGLGHATRCVPVINRLLDDGQNVVIGSDGIALDYLRNYFPQLKTIQLPALNIRYSAGKSQTATLMLQLPEIFKWIRQDRKALQQILQHEHFDLIISDNRFGLAAPRAVYITHQLHIRLPQPFRWLEPIAEMWHRKIIEQYTECWIPDYEDYPGLAGELSHPHRLPHNSRYIGPLSRFQPPLTRPDTDNSILAIISGPEPQRSIFEQEIKEHYDKVIIANGQPPFITDMELTEYMLKARQVVSRSGYSSIMDYDILGILDKAVMIPTPGQPEQEYLATLHKSKQ